MSETAAPYAPPRPQDDFDKFVNGHWYATNEIPEDQNRWGSFMLLREDNLRRCQELCERNPDTLVGQLYAKASSIGGGAAPAAVVELMQWASKEVVDGPSYQRVAARLLPLGVSLFLHICKSEDSKNPELRVPHISQSGLGLPDVSYYTERTDLHDDYVQYVSELSVAFGIPGVDGKKLLEFEKQIAAKWLTRTERRDPDRVYNKRNYASEVVPLLEPYFGALALPLDRMGDMIVDNPSLLSFLGPFLETADPAALRAHAVFSIARKFAPLSHAAAVDLHFGFEGQKLNGQLRIDPLWKRCVGVVEKYLGDELGKLYVAAHFPEAKRAECLAMVGDIFDALRDTLQQLEWMSPATKEHALEKLKRVNVKIGVPAAWHSIERLWDGSGVAHVGVEEAPAAVATPFGDMSLVEAVLAWYVWDWQVQEVEKFYTPTERELWHMTPQTVNAYYHPELSEIVFPAGILQPPFFGHATYEENIGAIGVVIAHEITHGFDDQGRKYDARGELRDWWSEADSAAFQQRAQVVVDHYAAQIVQGKNVNGQLTLGENIADIGGLKLALRAARRHFGGANVALSQEVCERFFTSYAKIWRMLVRDAMAMKLLAVDPHSPCHLRVNAALGHIEEFHATYGVVEGDGMFLPPNKRMTIW